MKQSAVLRVTGLTKNYPLKRSDPSGRYFTAVDNISFVLEEGEVLGVLGPNGAGKTTLIQMLLSVLTPTAGEIEYFGKDFYKHRSTILEQVSFASSYVRLPGQLTVRTNLDIYAQLYGISSNERAHRIEKYLKFFGMWNLADKETGVLSAGQMTRVMLAKAFISQPKVVLLDEPTASLDPDIAHDVRNFIVEQQKERGISLLITSHNMEEVSQICNRVLVMKHGAIIANNTPQNLALSVSRARVHLVTDNPEALARYLKDQQISYTVEEDTVTLDIDEQGIATLLTGLAVQGITYSQISIDTPSLHDYFLSITRESSDTRRSS